MLYNYRHNNILFLCKTLVFSCQKHDVSVVLESYDKYIKTCVKRLLSKRPKIGFQDQLSLNAGQKVLQNAPRGALCNSFDLH